jgi:hypothetical protein
MFFNYFKKGGKKKKNKGSKGNFTVNSYKKRNTISQIQMMEITNAVISKKRLFVYSESI